MLIIPAFLEMSGRGLRTTENTQESSRFEAAGARKCTGSKSSRHSVARARPERALSNSSSQSVCNRHVTASSASHWVSPSNHVTPAYRINKGKEKAVVRHFVDAGLVRVPQGGGRQGAEDPSECVWICASPFPTQDFGKRPASIGVKWKREVNRTEVGRGSMAASD